MSSTPPAATQAASPPPSASPTPSAKAPATSQSKPGVAGAMPSPAAPQSEASRLWGVLAAGAGAWIRSGPIERGPDRGPRFRWTYPELERAAAGAPPTLPNLDAALHQPDLVVATNAAIVFARSGNAAGLATLEKAVQTPELPLSLRCAAVESMASLSDAASPTSLRRLTDRYSGVERRDTAYVGELHAELLHALATRGAVDDPRYAKALRSSDPVVRIESLAALAVGPPGSLPAEALEMARVSDARTRKAALHAVAARRVPQAAQLLTASLNDVDLQVRLAAIAGLGVLGGDAARQSLQAALRDRGERVRLEAVRALAELGDEEAVFEARHDKAWQVRHVVAESLQRYRGPKAAEVARELLDDRSLAVQLKVVTVVGAWPIEEAAPVLFDAMGKSTYLPPQTAARLLAPHWSPAAEFPCDGSPQQRGDFLTSHRADFAAQFGAEVRQVSAILPVAAPVAPVAPVAPERVARLQRLLPLATAGAASASERAAALAEIQAIGPDLPEALAQLALDRHQPLPEVVWREILPVGNAAFAEIAKLQSSDRRVRRRAAEQLLLAARQSPLPRLAVARIASVVAPQDDPLVWHSIFEAVARDNTEPAVQLAYAAAGHASPEVRRLACVHMAAHPSPKHAQVLMPSLDDPSPPVVSAAVQALAACGPLDDVAPLLRLLGSPNERLRVDAACLLACQNHQAGSASLERLALSRDPLVRRQVAIAMGRAAQPAFASTLVRLLDDQSAVQVAALESLPRVTGRELPRELRGHQQRIDAWKAFTSSPQTSEIRSTPPQAAPSGTPGAPVRPSANAGPPAGPPRAADF